MHMKTVISLRPGNAVDANVGERESTLPILTQLRNHIGGRECSEALKLLDINKKVSACILWPVIGSRATSWFIFQA